MRKKVDDRIQTLIQNIITLHQRGFFLIVGDRGRDQVVNLHYLLSKHLLKAKPKVLWCYKKELGFSSHHQKRMKDIKKQQQKGNYDTDMENPFELFLSSNEIRYCYYKESQKVLGNTFQMLVLQDFESITPNILCRTIETVSGGGIVCLLIKSMKSLKQLYSIAMDAHSKFRTEAFQDVVPRFNERFLLSLADCKNTIVMDDELNILPISQTINDITLAKQEDSQDNKTKQALKELQESMKENQLVGPLVSLAKTLDQAKAIMMFVEAIVEKNFRSTISLTAGRGRGKSAAIGLSVAAAVQCGFSNIFVSAPSPENLKTFFEFVVNGLEALNYKENMHYDILQSTNQEFSNCIIRINIYKTHRQFIQFVFPNDCAKIGQSDLLVIDEAASIPLHYIKSMMGPYVMFLSSTINGYEGTGRSLSLKLISQLREQNRNSNQENSSRTGVGARLLKEITLVDPIRYSPGDPIEFWLNKLLLLEASQAVPIRTGLPHPDHCDLFLLNRDTLFSHHKASETFLFNMMSLFISSHYKNSPNDLQLLSDAPGHAVFVLMENQNKDTEKNHIPDILCIVQIAFEGQIQSSESQRGSRPAGDLIPWVMKEQYQDDNFPKLQGARIVRIATHPQAVKMGYGKKTLEILTKFFEGDLIDLSDNQTEQEDFFPKAPKSDQNNQTLQEEELKPKKKLKPLLKKLSQVKPPKLHYLGVSYGLTNELFKFWHKCQFYPTYLRQTKNDITAEHSCIMIKALKSTEELDSKWVQIFFDDFRRRFQSLLSYDFKTLPTGLCLAILDPRLSGSEETNENLIQKNELQQQINLYDLKRLESYKKNMVDYHLILDLLPVIARIFYLKRFSSTLSYSQAAILLGMGLQHKGVETVSEELNLPVSQSLALFVKAMTKLTNEIKKIYTDEIEKTLVVKEKEMNPVSHTNEKEIYNEGKKFIQSLEDKQQKEGKQFRTNFDMTKIQEGDFEGGQALLIKRNQKDLPVPQIQKKKKK